MREKKKPQRTYKLLDSTSHRVKKIKKKATIFINAYYFTTNDVILYIKKKP